MERMKAWGVLVVLLVFSVAAMGQTYEGRILGSVTDKSGGTVKDARVTITNVDTGVSRSLVTNEAGDYVAPSLPPGVYKITVEMTGFKKIERMGVRLEVAKDARIDFVLEPGAISESIRVTEEAPLVETTNDTLGGTFANKSINDLPLNGREYQNLVVLRPGVQRSPGGGFLSISSNGNRPEDNNFIFDGADNNDPYYGSQMINTEGVQGTPGSILPIDAIQEFNAVENPPAEYGGKPGAIINVGIRSGTNEVHGTAYYFGRNDNLDARNFFDTEINPNTGKFSGKKELRQHQFGGTFGGPIRKNKTFIFGGYEGVRALVGNTNQLNTPVTSSLGGDPANSIPDAIAALAARSIPVNPLSKNLIGTGAFTGNGPYPGLFPVNTSSSSSFITGFPNTNRMDAFVLKGDHHFNQQNSLSIRYFFGDSLQTEQDIPVRAAQWESQSQLRVQVLGANYIWAPNTRWVNELKFGYNRFWQSILPADHDKNPATTYGINTGVTDPVNLGMPDIFIVGFGSSSAATLGGNRGWPLLTVPNETYVFSDNASYSHGRHTFRFGGEFRQGKTHNLRNRFGKGFVQFSGGATFDGSTPLEDFLAGNPAFGQIFVGSSERFVSINSFAAFLQDDWRITPHLTVNAGIRYDLNSTIRERQNRLGNFDPKVGLEQVGVNINAPYDTDYNNFGPRLGLAWDPFGKGKTVIRAGGGIIYEFPHLVIFLGQNGVVNATTAGLNVIPTGATGAAIPGGTIKAAAFTVSPAWGTASPVFSLQASCDPSAPCDILGVTRNLRTPYVMSWNLNIQQTLGSSTSFQVGYVGNRGVKLYSVRDINQVSLTDGTRPFQAKFPFLGFINFMENLYSSTYHGLQASVTQRAWHGITFVGGYTWSHAIDFASLNRAPQPQNSLRPDLERGDSDLDIRHRFTLALSYDLPSHKGFGQLFEGWQINSIAVLQTGSPWTGFDFGNDFSQTGEFADRWDVIPGKKVSDIPGFAVGGPIPFQTVLRPCSPQPCFGNAGRNIFRGPSYRNWDFSLVKTQRLSERLNMQLRAEFFNVLNHPNFGIPGSLLVNAFNNDLSSPDSFGQVPGTPDVVAANPFIGTGGPRNIQLGVKFKF